MSNGVNILLKSFTVDPDIEVDRDVSLPSIDHSHQQIHNGNGFTHSDKHVGIGAGATAYHLIKVGVNPIHIRHFSIQATDSPVEITYYEGATITVDGTPLLVGNNNRNSLKVTTTGLFEAPTITDNGTALGVNLIPPGGPSKAGGDVDIITGGEWVLKPSTNYLYAVTNNATGDITIYTTMFFYEPSAS